MVTVAWCAPLLLPSPFPSLSPPSPSSHPSLPSRLPPPLPRHSLGCSFSVMPNGFVLHAAACIAIVVKGLGRTRQRLLAGAGIGSRLEKVLPSLFIPASFFPQPLFPSHFFPLPSLLCNVGPQLFPQGRGETRKPTPSPTLAYMR